jgi:class 3 adenylate cyclase
VNETRTSARSTPLPTGRVTFLFTDIEGSTKLLHRFGDEYAEVLAAHHRLLRAAFTTTTAARSTFRR